MYVVAEITRLETINSFYSPMPEHPFVVSRKFWYGDANVDIASFWSTTFGVTEPLTEKTSITGVVYANNVNYSVKEDLAQCLLDEQSFFWDSASQTLHIHLNHQHYMSIVDGNFDLGIAVGLTNDKIRYFEDRVYRPLLVDFPEVEVSADKFNYDMLSFIVSTMQTDNKSGFFNQFKTVPIYGNKVSIKTGNEGDTYADLVERATYYVDDYTFSADIFDIDIQDIRKTLTAQVPNNILNTTDYPQLGDNAVGSIVPFGYSPLNVPIKDVPGLPVNENELATADPKFIFLEVLVSTTSDIVVYVENSDKAWVQDTGVTVDAITGIVTVPSAKTGTSPDFNVLKVKADVFGVTITYASDIIKDLNSRYLGISYDSSNYSTPEWVVEEAYLAPIAFYMDKTKDIYEWIRDIQSLSSLGFRYTTTFDNKRTIRVDNPNRVVVANVPSVHIKNIPDIKADSNKDDVYNKLYIGYNASILNKTAPRAENTDYYAESYAEYKIESVYNKTTGLVTQLDAENRALIQAEDYYRIHKVFEVELIGSQYLDLRIYDIIEVDLTLQQFILTYNKVLIETLTGLPYLEQLDGADIKTEVISSITSATIGDEYFGTVRGQIVSKRPNYELQTNTIKVRQKDFSTIWESIHG